MVRSLYIIVLKDSVGLSVLPLVPILQQVCNEEGAVSSLYDLSEALLACPIDFVQVLRSGSLRFALAL